MATTRKRPRTPHQDFDEREEVVRVTPAKVVNKIRGWIAIGHAAIELKHISEEGSTRVQRWRLKDDEGPANAEDIAHQVAMSAQDDAEGLGGYQKYGVFAFEAEGPGVGHIARCIFEVRCDGEVDDDSSPREGCLTAQLMRHIEVKDRMLVNMFQDIVGTQSSHIKRQEERLTHYEERSFDQYLQLEQLVSANHERKLAELKNEQQIKALGRIGEQLALGVPVVLNRLLGSGTKKPVAGIDVLKQLFSKLHGQGEKVAKLMGVLKPEELGLLSELQKTVRSGGGDPILTEHIIKEFLGRVSEEDKIVKLMSILDPEEFALIAQLFKLYAAKEKAETPDVAQKKAAGGRHERKDRKRYLERGRAPRGNVRGRQRQRAESRAECAGEDRAQPAR